MTADNLSPADLQNAKVVDSTGASMGDVKQLFVTQDGHAPSWVTVNTGLFGTKETFIPLAEAKVESGTISVPYEKSFIKDAPNVDEDGEITPEQEDELYRYYGVADSDVPGQAHGTDRRDDDLRDGRHDHSDLRDERRHDDLHDGRRDGGLGHDRRDHDDPRDDRRNGELGDHGAGVDGAAGAAGAAGVGAAAGTHRDRDRDGLQDGARDDHDRLGQDDHDRASQDRDLMGHDQDRRDADRDHMGGNTHVDRGRDNQDGLESQGGLRRGRLRRYTVTETRDADGVVEREETIVETDDLGDQDGLRNRHGAEDQDGLGTERL